MYIKNTTNDEWDNNNLDLDSHLIGDVDDVNYYSPETVIIYNPIKDDYYFYVYNYSHRSADELMASGAKVQVYRGDSSTPWKTFYVPQEQGYVWNVFKYNGETGELTPENNITLYY